MKTELNNTGILLVDLNETEIKLAIELYKLAGFDVFNEKSNGSISVGVFDRSIGFWASHSKEFKLITIHQLVFESGLNPDWADEVIHTGDNLFWYGDNQGKPFSTSMKSHGNGEVVIKKQTQEWPDENRINAISQNGNNGEHYEQVHFNSHDIHPDHKPATKGEISKALEQIVALENEAVKNPSHYQFFDGVEVIEIIASSMTIEQFKGYCLGNRIKYRLHAGNKDELQQDIDKSDFYVELYEKHKHLCRGE